MNPVAKKDTVANAWHTIDPGVSYQPVISPRNMKKLTIEV